MNRSYLNGFYIDIEASDEEYLFIDVDGFTVAIKREAEGIVCDIFPLHVVDEPITSTWALFSDVQSEEPMGRVEKIATRETG